MRARIGTQVVLGVAVVAGLTIGLLSIIIVNAERAALISELTRGVNQIGETIKSSTHHDMLENRRDNLRRQFETIGRQEGIESVRLFNKEGQIAFSSDAAEVGRSVDKQAESCYACHAAGHPLTRLPMKERSRVFRARDGHRVLGIIHPIANQPACAAGDCHAHAATETVLGVLDVAVSLAEVDRDTARSQRWMVGLAAAAILMSSAMLLFLHRRLVLRPVRELAAATRRVADGDLTTSISVRSRNELGDLSHAFNDMVRRLADTQRQLTQADKLASLGRLAAGVAHEINNPLTGVLTYASFLAKRAESPEVAADLEVIVRETKRCREIVKGLLDFSRQTPGKRQPTDLNEVVRRAAGIVMNQLSLAHLSLSLEMPGGLPPVSADPNQIQQVLVNLILNAAEAMEKGPGTVRVSTAEREGGVEVAVEDTGSGIDPEDLPHIFDPFYSTKGMKGTGLGLAITWGLVQAHGGTIEVKSEVGHGACFRVRLPACPPGGTHA